VVIFLIVVLEIETHRKCDRLFVQNLKAELAWKKFNMSISTLSRAKLI
jgi:hypothetical protein